MKVLLVGAGAVGQVYGRHLQLGGADITFFVKEKYAAECRAGLTVYPLKNKRDRDPVAFTDFGVVTTPEEVAGQSWDQLWLCISATALRGQWFDDLLKACGDVTLVTLQPGLKEAEWLAERHPVEKTVSGVIAFISYQAPLKGETVPTPGVAYTFPPMSPSPFSGPSALVDPLVAALKRGGCPAKTHSDAAAWGANPTAVMMPTLAALESAGWKFAGLSRSENLPLATAASREAMAIAAAHRKKGPPFTRNFIRPWLIKLILWLGPKLMPFDLETYIEYHFTKVGDQTRYIMTSYIELGQAVSLPTGSLQALYQRVWGAQEAELNEAAKATSAAPAG